MWSTARSSCASTPTCRGCLGPFGPRCRRCTLKLGEIGLVNFIAENTRQGGDRRHGDLQRAARHGRDLLQQDRVLLLHRAASEARRAHGDGRCSSSSRPTWRTTAISRRRGRSRSPTRSFRPPERDNRSRRRTGDEAGKSCRRTPAVIGRAARGWDRTIMAEAHAKHHDYHLVDPSPWPIIGAVSAFVLALALIFAMHGQISWWWLAPGHARRALHHVRLVGGRHQGSAPRRPYAASCSSTSATA